jgi:hypothetical protein
MPSKAIQRLDEWLTRAEEVLAEQREHAISPSLGLVEADGREEWTITLAALSGGLESLLESLFRRPGRWILIIEHARRSQLFVQFLAYEDGSGCSEVVSNTYLDGDDRWTTEQEARLLALGWDPPVRPLRPNFIHVEYTTSPAIEIECRRAIGTISEMFGLSGHHQVFVKLFSSAIRGDTPASPVYSTEDDASPLPHHDVVDDAQELSDGIIEDADSASLFPANVDRSDEQLPTDIRWCSIDEGAG